MGGGVCSLGVEVGVGRGGRGLVVGFVGFVWFLGEYIIVRG